MAVKQLKGSISDEFEDADEVLQGDADDITELMGDVDADLNSVTSEFGKDKNDVQLKIKLHRVLERKGEREWLFDILPSELPIMDRVKEEYGGGKYEAAVFKNGKLFRKFNFNIANPRVNSVIKNSASEFANIVAMMGKQQETQFAQLKELVLSQKSPAQSFNMMEMMTGMVTLMVQMKNLMPSTGNSNNIDLLLKGMEIMKDFGGGGGGGETTMMDVFKELIKSPLLEKAIEGVSTVVPQSAIANNPVIKKPPSISQSSNHQSNNSQSNNSQPSQGNANMPNVNPVIKGYVNQLIQKAERNSDPALYAAFILDNVPENLVKEYLMREDLMDFIISINPNAAKHSEWFNELKNELTEILLEDASENLTDNGQSNDTGGNAQRAANPVDGDTIG